MHEAVFYLAAVWLTGLVAACTLFLVRAESLTSRILALDTLVLVLVALLVVYSSSERVPFFLDAALMLSLLGFVATLAASRFHGDGGPFG